MIWTPATSLSPRAAHPSRVRIPSEHRESTHLFRSYREGFDLAGKDPSPKSVRFFTCHSTLPSSFFSAFGHRLSKNQADATAITRKWESPDSSQFWCTVSSLDATLVNPLLSVANKELTQFLSLLDATLTKNTGWGLSASGSFQLPSSLAITLKFFLFIFLCTLLHSRKSQLFYFQAIPHSLPKITRGGVSLDPFSLPRYLLLPLILTRGVN
jgi:hypothetical protein